MFVCVVSLSQPSSRDLDYPLGCIKNHQTVILYTSVVAFSAYINNENIWQVKIFGQKNTLKINLPKIVKFLKIGVRKYNKSEKYFLLKFFRRIFWIVYVYVLNFP